MNLAGCPDIVELESYVDGELASGERDGIARHVESCASCRDRLEEIHANLQLAIPVREFLANQLRAPSASAGSTPDPSLALRARHGVAAGGSIRGYRLIRELGRGGMGVVFLAEQEYPRREVALKLLLPGSSAASQHDRFAREANLLAQLHHPGIAQVYEAGMAEDIGGFEFAGRAFIAMEYVAGQPLDRYADHHGLSTRGKCVLLAKVCDAVHHAHVHGVIHRDLKPSNILVVDPVGDEPGPGAQPKILDFGVARATDADVQAVTYQTEIGQLIGTIPYMSPEQVTGDSRQVDARSDVYSLGVIGYRLFSGVPPYHVDGRSLPAAVETIRSVEPVPLARHDASLRGDVEVIIHKALQKDVSQRYQSAAEMAADLRRFLDDEPIAACPPTTWYQLRKFTRRNRGLVTASILVAASLILGSAAALWQAAAALDARDAAERRLDVARESADFLLYGLGFRHARVFGGTEINRDLMERVYSYYKRILGEQPNDLAARQNVWGALQSWAQAVHETGQRDRAETMLHEARTLADRAAAEDPGNTAFRTDVGRIDFSLALVLQDLGALDEALQRMTNALDMFQTARDVFDTDPIFRGTHLPEDKRLEYWRKLAQINRCLGNIHRDAWNLDQAADRYRDAMQYCDKLAAAAPDVPFYGMREPALAMVERGRLRLALGDFASAESDERSANQRLEDAFASDLDDPAYAVPLAQARHELARASFLNGRFEAAATWAARSVELTTRLLEADKAHVVYRRSLADSTALLSCAATGAGDHTQAKSAGQRAMELAGLILTDDDSGPPELLSAGRVLLMIQPNDPSEAVEAARRARARLRRSVPEYDATLAMALAASGDVEGGLQMLHAAIEGVPQSAGELRRVLGNLETRIRRGSTGIAPADLLRLR